MSGNFTAIATGDVYTYETLDKALDTAKRNVASRSGNRNAEIVIYQAVKTVKSPVPEAIVEDVK